MKELVMLLTVVALSVAPARATTAFAVAGSAQFGDSSCLELAGAGAPVANRFRMEGIYTPSGATLNDAGVCPETDEHIDLEVVCAAAEGSEAFLGARLTVRSWLVFRIVEGSAIGVATTSTLPSGSTCGAAEVPTVPVTAGTFAISTL